jgi:peptide/nickel transport system substrate-binding protein
MGEIERRKLLTVLGASGAGMIAGCGGNQQDGDGSGTDGGTAESDGTSVSEETTTTPEDSNIQRGGTFQIGFGAEPDTLNPYQTASKVTLRLARWLYSGLVISDNNLEVRGELATDWEANEALDVWTFELRDDATFNHNGNTVLAEDVVASYSALANNSELTAYERGGSIMDQVEIVNDNRVEITLQEPSADFPSLISRPWAVVFPKDIVDNGFDGVGSEAFGSGPFVLEEFNQSAGGTLTASDDFFETGEDGDPLPYLDGIEYTIQPELTTRISSLSTGEIHFAGSVTQAVASQVENNSQTRLLSKSGGSFSLIMMDTTVEPFSNRNLRHAIKYAVDEQACVEGSLGGYGTVAQHHMVSPVLPFHQELETKFGPGARPDQAQQMLEEAGMGDGVQIEPPLWVAPEQSPDLESTAQLVQEQCSEVGIEFDLQTAELTTFFDEVETVAPWYIVNFSFRPTEETAIASSITADAAFNGVKWHEGQPDAYQRFEEEFERANSTLDESVRSESYLNVMRIIRDNAGAMLPYFLDRLGAVSEDVNGFELHPSDQNIRLRNVWIN